MNFLIQVTSLVGAAIVLVAYFMLQRRRWTDHDGIYLLFNLIGATLLIIVALWDRSAGFLVLECTWAGISVWSMLSGRSDRSTSSNT